MKSESCKPQQVVGNLFGAARAEVDNVMLENAFVKTHDYRALTKTHDFNFVVGRRGTGKTALFIKVAEYFSEKNNLYLYKIRPEEHAALSFRSLIENITSDYQIARAICRVCWRANLLIEVTLDLKKHWKITRSTEAAFLQSYITKHGELSNNDLFSRLYSLLDSSRKVAKNSQEIPGIIAQSTELSKLQKAVQNVLETLNSSAIFLFDDLDEGWLPSIEFSGILGGLAIAVADLRDSHTGIHSILFIRDNIFRSLATTDLDFSRHIEGNTLRLHWNEESLFYLTSERLRFTLSLDIENKTKIWNRFAQNKLKGKEGFRFCLQFTLYRPRDILVLLNQAFLVAARGGRKEIIEEDIEISSRQIAQDRLKDLANEYSHVFPGLGLFIELFRDRPALVEYNLIVSFLDSLIDNNPYSNELSSDYAVLGSGTELFNALYSVGFLGLQNRITKTFMFCHDGAGSDLATIKPEQKCVIHPCYWKALGINSEESDHSIIVNVNDEYDIKENPDVIALRIRRLGQLVSELPNLAFGTEGCSEFEEWVFRIVKMLFAGDLHNPELKPNRNSIQRRDIVATNMSEKGFWKRIFEDYKSRQVIFEVKNYKELGPDDYRQALSYTGNDYGKFVIIVTRNENEYLTTKEIGWVKEMYHQHNNLIIFILPALILARCVKKLRNPDRREYTDQTLSKRLDTFIRSYISLTHLPPSKKKRKKHKSS